MAKKKKKKKKPGRRARKTPSYAIGFALPKKSAEVLQKIAKAAQDREERNVSVHAMAKRIVVWTASRWQQSLDNSQVDLNDPSWRPPI